jgi:peptidyl-prolyl cis-trans isomerase B (cyclophilin B)
MSDIQDIKITMHTSMGDMDITIFASEVPVTAASFLNLATRGYYDGLIFHRIISGFMNQGGCPDGSGMGGPGYKFECECKPNLQHSKPGILSMANAGRNTNGSQFFITHVPTQFLNGRHAVFGEVTEGLNVALAMGDVDTDSDDRPLKDVIIKGITIHDSTEALFTDLKDRIAAWNAALN